jgi:cytochrome c553
MQITLYNLKRWLPISGLFLLVIIVLIRMMIHGSESHYHTESTDAVLIYREACAGCHGQQGKGVHFYIPDLADETLTAEEVKMKISTGGLVMPAFIKLNNIQIDHLSDYVMNKNFK